MNAFKVGDKVAVAYGCTDDWVSQVWKGDPVFTVRAVWVAGSFPTIQFQELYQSYPNHWRSEKNYRLVKSGPVQMAGIQDRLNEKLYGTYPTLTPGEAINKPANPKQAYGDKKPPLQLIHSIALLHESAAMHAGKLKYGENNYIQADVEVMTYAGAIRRHLDQYIAGERVDAKELVHHLGAIRACCEILLVAEACGTLIDNRPVVWGTAPQYGTPPRVPYGTAFKATFEEVEKIIEHLNNLYPQTPKQ